MAHSPPASQRLLVEEHTVDPAPGVRSSRGRRLPTPPEAPLERGVIETSSLPFTPRLRGSTAIWQLPVSLQLPSTVSLLVCPAHAGIEAPTLPLERAGLARKAKHYQQSQCATASHDNYRYSEPSCKHSSHWQGGTRSSLWRERGWQGRPGTANRPGTISNS